jgi:hypothetical protein
MKKIFTLIAATFLTIAVFAADRRPSVTLMTSRNYEVIIDDQSYSGNGVMEISLMHKGQHSIKVYEQKRGRFFNLRGKKLVSATTFQVGRDDIDISIDFRGQINISEDRLGHDKWNNEDNGYGHDKGYGNNKNDHDRRF